MIIKEFRIVMPMTVEEYQIAQLYSVAEASKNETGGGEGIEVLANDPFDISEGVGVKPTESLLDSYNTGQYTHKIYHLASKVPKFIRMIAPKGSLEIVEKAWNAYPYCRTVVSNPDYMKDNFFIKIESLHLPDRGTTENAHKLDGDKLKKREVVTIDITNDPVDRKDYKEDEDPSKFKSTKTGRGPLLKLEDSKGARWQDQVNPVMTCYKLVTVEFKWWGLQNRVEKFIQKSERRIFTNFHRQVFCWTDQWHGLTMKDIRDHEEKTKHELDVQRQQGETRGTKAEDE